MKVGQTQAYWSTRVEIGKKDVKKRRESVVVETVARIGLLQKN